MMSSKVRSPAACWPDGRCPAREHPGFYWRKGATLSTLELTDSHGTFPPGMGVECGDGAARDSSGHIVGPARQNHGHPRAEHDPGGLSRGEKALLFDEYVAGLHVGNEQDVGIASDRGPVIWPRSAILQSMGQLNCVLQDIDLVLQRRNDVHRGIGDQQQLGVSW